MCGQAELSPLPFHRLTCPFRLSSAESVRDTKYHSHNIGFAWCTYVNANVPRREGTVSAGVRGWAGGGAPDLAQRIGGVASMLSGTTPRPPLTNRDPTVEHARKAGFAESCGWSHVALLADRGGGGVSRTQERDSSANGSWSAFSGRFKQIGEMQAQSYVKLGRLALKNMAKRDGGQVYRERCG